MTNKTKPQAHTPGRFTKRRANGQFGHTPAPWTVGQHPMLEVSAIPADGDLGRRSIICGVYGSHLGVGMANARLIAAAPDLLEAAKDVLMFQDYPTLRAAVAKAEGQEAR